MQLKQTIFTFILKKTVIYNNITVSLSDINNNNLSTMSKGTVKFFNESKGFGFISEDGSKKEHFVHISGLIDQIREGDTVEFDLQEGKKGLNAVNVKVI